MSQESLQLAPTYAASKAFAVWTARATALAWNGTAFVARTAANLVLGAVTGVFDATGYASFAVPSAVSVVLYDVAIYSYAGSVPVASDITGASVQPLGTGGNISISILGPSGPYVINQDGGFGAANATDTFYIPSSNVTGVPSATDLLRFTGTGGVGIPNIQLRAYLLSDYNLGLRNLLAQSSTSSDGRWVAPIMLSSGTYIVTADTDTDGYVATDFKVAIP